MKSLLLSGCLFASSLAFATDGVHHVVMQVDQNDPKIMALTLNNAANMNAYYLDKGEQAEIDIVTYGPGLNMLRSDTSPVKDRIISFGQNFDNIHFKACGNTIAKMKRKSGKDVPLLPNAKVVPAGAVYIVEREEDGWSYIRP